MATQQLIFAETVAAMKKALKRKAYESDSDDTIDHYGNRGHKLQKRARFSQQGQLRPPSGPEVYKEVIEFAGVRREIISRNPPLVDEDGYEVETDDDEERVHNALADAADLNPYANIRLETLLAPLTAVTDLPTHPTLRRPFTSKTLTKLGDQAGQLTRKENTSLWKVKHLMTRFCGDYDWVPCGKMLGPNDLALYSDDYVLRSLLQAGKMPAATAEPDIGSSETVSGDRRKEVGLESTNGGRGAAAAPKSEALGQDTADPDATMSDPGLNELETAQDANRDEVSKNIPGEPGHSQPPTDVRNGEQKDSAPNGGTRGKEATEKDKPEGATGQEKDANVKIEEDVNQEAPPAQSPALNPTGEVPAPEVGNGGITPPVQDGVDELFIHPFFLPPAGAMPDRDFNLPGPEAEDIRRLLALYVQKQEEICRGSKRLYEGLLKADRLRDTVLKWSKAEAHCGGNRDLSDGEDWYDKEEWGLVDDLKKGQDEEEEETGVTAKKTRNRR